MTFNRFSGLRTLHAHGTLAGGSFFARVPTFSGAGNAMSAYKRVLRLFLRHAPRRVERVSTRPLLSKLAGIPPVDRAIFWGYWTRSARAEIRFPVLLSRLSKVQHRL